MPQMNTMREKSSHLVKTPETMKEKPKLVTKPDVSLIVDKVLAWYVNVEQISYALEGQPANIVNRVNEHQLWELSNEEIKTLSNLTKETANTVMLFIKEVSWNTNQ